MRVLDEDAHGRSRRFWEQDYNIYGGLSFLVAGPEQQSVWYPSANLMASNRASLLLVTKNEM